MNDHQSDVSHVLALMRSHSPPAGSGPSRSRFAGRLRGARSPSYAEGFSGQHAGDLLVIVDEASGVAAPIWSAIHGLAASRLVVAGNPIRYDCHFRELHDRAGKGSSTITSVGISSLESPDARNDVSPVGMASRTFLNQMREIHGEESPWWRSNILGIFPGQESVRFLPSAWLDACTCSARVSCIGIVNVVPERPLEDLFRYPSRAGRGYPPRIFSEAHHGTEASRALTVGARTKPPVRPSSEPALVRCFLGSERTRRVWAGQKS